MGSFLIGIGLDILKGYLEDLFEFGIDSIIGWVDELTKKYGEKDVLKSFPEIYNSIYDDIITNFDIIMEQNNTINYKDTQIFKSFDKDKVVKEINKIIKGLNYEIDIKQKVKKVYNENSQFGKDFGFLNILLNGDDNIINKFIEIFNINKNNTNEYYFNNVTKGKDEKNKSEEINILEQCKILQVKFYNKNNAKDINIDCKWEFVGKSKLDKNITMSTTNTSDNIPIIYIYFLDDVEKEKIYGFYELKSSVEYLNYKILFSNHIFEISTNNDSYLFDLCEKTVLNIIIHKYKVDIEKKSNEIRNEIFSPNNFSFGNEIDNLYIMNLQIIQSIFKKFIGKRIPDSIKIVIKGYQDNISKRKNVFLSEIFDKIIPWIKTILYNKKNLIPSLTFYDEKNKQLKIDIIDTTLILLDQISYDGDNEKKGKKIFKVKSMKIDSLNQIIKTKLEDFFLRKACYFINEVIINAIEEKIIDLYSIRIITNYFKNHKKELVFIDCKGIK